MKRCSSTALSVFLLSSCYEVSYARYHDWDWVLSCKFMTLASTQGLFILLSHQQTVLQRPCRRGHRMHVFLIVLLSPSLPTEFFFLAQAQLPWCLELQPQWVLSSLLPAHIPLRKDLGRRQWLPCCTKRHRSELQGLPPTLRYHLR